jgi:hypothetical protein
MSSIESVEHGPRKHPDPSVQARRASAVRRTIAAFVPSGNHTEIAALFDNRVAVQTIRQWRLGRRLMPQWAKDLLKAKMPPVDDIETGPGSIVGKYNLPSIKEKARLQGGLDSRPLIEKR